MEHLLSVALLACVVWGLFRFFPEEGSLPPISLDALFQAFVERGVRQPDGSVALFGTMTVILNQVPREDFGRVCSHVEAHLIDGQFIRIRIGIERNGEPGTLHVSDVCCDGFPDHIIFWDVSETFGYSLWPNRKHPMTHKQAQDLYRWSIETVLKSIGVANASRKAA